MTRWIIAALVLYLICYTGFRVLNTQVREMNGEFYVIYPADMTWLYTLFRPAAYVDAALTGQRSHIGPHPEEASQ